MTTHRDLLKRWPSYDAVREDLTARGVPLSPFAVPRWAQRLSVPSDYWPLLDSAATARGFTATVNEWAAAQRRPKFRVRNAA